MKVTITTPTKTYDILIDTLPQITLNKKVAILQILQLQVFI